MGFAIIPIIYSISEEALSNVPKRLIAASLSLGATPWQTLTRLVLVSATPGIFSAVMIGFGRASSDEIFRAVLWDVVVDYYNLIIRNHGKNVLCRAKSEL